MEGCMTLSRTLVVWINICPMPTVETNSNSIQIQNVCKSHPPISATSTEESPTEEKTTEVVGDVTDTADSSAKPVDIADNEIMLIQVRNSSLFTLCLSSN